MKLCKFHVCQIKWLKCKDIQIEHYHNNNNSKEKHRCKIYVANFLKISKIEYAVELHWICCFEHFKQSKSQFTIQTIITKCSWLPFWGSEKLNLNGIANVFQFKFEFCWECFGGEKMSWGFDPIFRYNEIEVRYDLSRLKLRLLNPLKICNV